MMTPNPYGFRTPEREPVMLPSDGAPPEGRPIIIHDEGELQPEEFERGRYETAKRRVRRMPGTIAGYGAPFLLVGGLMVWASLTQIQGFDGSGELAFMVATMGALLMLPGLVTVCLAIVASRRWRFAYGVLIGLYVLPFISAVVLAPFLPGLLRQVQGSGDPALNPGIYLLLLLLVPLAFGSPLSIWGIMELIRLIREGRALRTVERYEQAHPEAAK